MSWNKSSLFVILAAVWCLQYVTFATALPLHPLEENGYINDSEDVDKFPLGNPDLFEGDMILTKKQFQEYYGDDSSHINNNQNEHVSMVLILY